MRDLRDEIADELIAQGHYYGEWEIQRKSALANADAVLRVVGERLLSDEAVEAAWGHHNADGADEDEEIRDMGVALSAAWRVVTGSNHE